MKNYLVYNIATGGIVALTDDYSGYDIGITMQYIAIVAGYPLTQRWDAATKAFVADNTLLHEELKAGLIAGLASMIEQEIAAVEILVPQTHRIGLSQYVDFGLLPRKIVIAAYNENISVQQKIKNIKKILGLLETSKNYLSDYNQWYQKIISLSTEALKRDRLYNIINNGYFYCNRIFTETFNLAYNDFSRYDIPVLSDNLRLRTWDAVFDSTTPDVNGLPDGLYGVKESRPYSSSTYATRMPAVILKGTTATPTSGWSMTDLPLLVASEFEFGVKFRFVNFAAGARFFCGITKDTTINGARNLDKYTTIDPFFYANGIMIEANDVEEDFGVTIPKLSGEGRCLRVRDNSLLNSNSLYNTRYPYSFNDNGPSTERTPVFYTPQPSDIFEMRIIKPVNNSTIGYHNIVLKTTDDKFLAVSEGTINNNLVYPQIFINKNTSTTDVEIEIFKIWVKN